MMDEQHLADLDRRAAAALQALDDAVAAAPVPEPAGHGATPPGRRWVAAAVAAAVVVVLVAAGVLLRDGRDEQGTIAGEPDTDDPAPPSDGHTQLALPDPGALGYRVVAAFPAGETSTGTFTGRDVTVTVQVPEGAEQPWPVTVVEYALPSEMTTLDGEPVDIGGPEAMLSLDGAAPSVGWIDGDRTRYLMSADSSVGELVLLATAAAAVTEPNAPLPGHDILHTGPFVDVFPMLATNTGTPSGNISGIVYESDVVGFVVGTTHGSPERWRAAHALAESVQQVEVRSRPAVLADFGGNIVEASWLEADGTLVRVDSLQGILPIEVLDQLEPITDTAFAVLIEQFGIDPPPGQSSEGRQGEEQPGVGLARIETDDGDVTISASVISQGQRELELRTFTEGPTGGTGTAQTLPDLSTNVVVRHVIQLEASDSRGTLLAGLIGPGVTNPSVVDATTGEVLTVGTGPLTATIEGSDHSLFLATLPPGFENRDLAIVGTSATGEEARLESPAT